MQAKACRYFLSRLDNGKCALLVLALRLACILQGYHMNAEEQEEPILRLRTLSGGRTGLGKWKVNASFTGHAGLCMRAHEAVFSRWSFGPQDVEGEGMAEWKVSRWQPLALGQASYSALRSSSWHLPLNKGKGKEKGPLLPLRSHC